MIRQDYFMKTVQELEQALARMSYLRRQQQPDLALHTIDQTLTDLFSAPGPTVLTLEAVLAAFPPEPSLAAEQWVMLADLLAARAQLARERGDPQGQRASCALALGLYLETLRTSVVSLDLIRKTDQMIEKTAGMALPEEVLQRLFEYYEAKGLLAKAEDTLYDWLMTGDAKAHESGLAFYDRLLAKSDEELRENGLPREEVAHGKSEWKRRTSPLPGAGDATPGSANSDRPCAPADSPLTPPTA
jgi:hypothetical protein